MEEQDNLFRGERDESEQSRGGEGEFSNIAEGAEWDDGLYCSEDFEPYRV